jgi:hypothetical protein
MPLYSSKQVKVIATTGAERLRSAPEIPTLKESGAPLVTFAWLGVYARSGTPQSIVDLLNGKVVAIVIHPNTGRWWSSWGRSRSPRPRRNFRRSSTRQSKRWLRLCRNSACSWIRPYPAFGRCECTLSRKWFIQSESVLVQQSGLVFEQAPRYSSNADRKGGGIAIAFRVSCAMQIGVRAA